MLDELRGSDWMSRSSRKGQKDIEVAMRRLEHALGRTPLESEIAAEMGLPLVEYQSLLSKVRGTQLVYLEDMHRADEDDDSYLDRHVADSSADPLNVLRDQRLRAIHHEHVLRTGHEPQRDCRSTGCNGIPHLPAA